MSESSSQAHLDTIASGIAGAPVRVVETSVAGLHARLDKLETWAWGKPTVVTLYCSFCGKSQHEVGKLIAGPKVFICDECVELCTDIILEENKAAKGASA